VSALRLSARARQDMVMIGVRRAEGWGVQHAANYLAKLDACFHRLATMPDLGRACDHIRPGLRRIEEGRACGFYRHQSEGSIRIVRVLDQRMQPELHDLEDDEDDDEELEG
jgi:toxin ParE1/3/4